MSSCDIYMFQKTITINTENTLILYNKLSYEDDEDSEMDMIILKAIIDNLDDYYFDE